MGARRSLPVAPHLFSEVKLLAELAKVTLDPNPKTPWDAWTDDYSLIRRSIGETYPEIFYDYDRRMWKPGGFHRALPAREREWKTKMGKANFITPRSLEKNPDMPETGHDVLRMMTLRSNDQFNTTVYGYDDRFRGINGTRMVVLMNRDDIDRLGLAEGEAGDPAHVRERRCSAGDIRLPGDAYNIPGGCIGTYYPEANSLIPIWHYAEGSKTPAAKSVSVSVVKAPRTAAQSDVATVRQTEYVA